jgi:hypothetical protein
MLDEMEQKGIIGFVDKAGREWNIARYTEMLARTTVMNARNESKMNDWRLRGHDLVRVSSHETVCEKCKPWEGAVLSISGETKKYPSLAEAREAGLFHPNCQHSTGLFVDLDDLDEEVPDAVEEDEQPEDGSATDEQDEGLSAGKGDADGYSSIIAKEPFDINDSGAIEKAFGEFAEETIDSAIEKAVVISPDGHRYDIDGISYRVSINLVGSDSLKGSKAIHNHPDDPEIGIDSFSRDDFTKFFEYGHDTLEVVYKGKRHSMEWVGERLTAAEAQKVYEDALRSVLEDAKKNGGEVQNEQYEIMRYLKINLKGLVFDEL